MHEWPILIFTILFTAAVGLSGFVALSGVLLKGEPDCALRYEVMRNPMLAACGLAFVGLAVSFAHIGYPLNAPHALRNLMSSALSREIVLTSAFVGVTCLATLLALRMNCVSLVAVVVCFAIGLCAIWFMGEVYRSAAVVTWMHPNTQVMFFGGTLTMGPVLGLALVGPTVGRRGGFIVLRKLFGWTAAFVLVGIAAQLVVLPSYVMAISANPLNDVVSVPSQPLEVFQSLAGLRCLRWTASMAGTATLFYAAWRVARSTERPGFAVTIAAGALLFGGEIIGRYVFYSIYS